MTDNRRQKLTASELKESLQTDPQYLAAGGEKDRKRQEWMAQDAPEWEMLREALRVAGVDPTDLGRFVNDTRYFEPSRFDERAAMPVLIEMLPRLSRPVVVGAVAAHLAHPWARPLAFDSLLQAFRRWAEEDQVHAGWQLGSALARTSDVSHLDVLLDLARDKRYGTSRQMLVKSLWRFRKDPRIESVLIELLHDDDVSLHAASALQRTIGRKGAARIFTGLLDTEVSPRLRTVASRQLKRIENAERASEEK